MTHITLEIITSSYFFPTCHLRDLQDKHNNKEYTLQINTNLIYEIHLLIFFPHVTQASSRGWRICWVRTRLAPLGLLGVSDQEPVAAWLSITRSSPSSSLLFVHAAAMVAPPSTCAKLRDVPTSPCPPPSGTPFQLPCPTLTSSHQDGRHVVADYGDAGIDDDSFAKVMCGKAINNLDSWLSRYRKIFKIYFFCLLLPIFLN
jgi:hypothetical protein